MVNRGANPLDKDNAQDTPLGLAHSKGLKDLVGVMVRAREAQLMH